MRYHVLATDYDGTLATHGRVTEQTFQALKQLKNSGRKIILVTGRELPDLLQVFPQAEIFDRIVAEDGALVYEPSKKQKRVLGHAPPPELIDALKNRNVSPLSVGEVLLSSWEPHEKTIVEVIRELGLEYQIIFNKGAVMVLPSGINKAKGLKEALADLGYSVHNVIGFGDAENDHAFLRICECSVAVNNALDSVKKEADIVTQGRHGSGVEEIINRLIECDLEDLEIKRHQIPFGKISDDHNLTITPYGHNLLLCGTSGSGKSTLATGFLERVSEAGYQFCIIDPEGDYETFEGATTLGSPQHGPSVEEVLKFIEKSRDNLVVNLLGIPLKDRPLFFENLFIRLDQLRAKLGRPHWVVIDETHHMLPADFQTTLPLPKSFQGLFLITVHPDHLWKPILSAVDILLAVGQTPESVFRAVGEALNESVPTTPVQALEPGEALAWYRGKDQRLVQFKALPSKTQRRRHLRKYADGSLPPDRSFYFRGPKNKTNLRAQNLQMFIQLLEGIDDVTWDYHLKRGDYSHWIEECIKDATLAQKVSEIENNSRTNTPKSRELVKSAIEARYTA